MKPNLLLFTIVAAFALLGRLAAQTIEVTSTGVGIGTSTPGRKLEVNNDLGVSTGEKFIANFTQLAGQNGLYVGYRANGSSVTSSLLRADNNLPITFGTSGANQAVTITNAGEVGIGTTNPGVSLEVSGSASAFASTSGTYQPGASARIGNSQTNGVLDIGVNSGGGAWLQYTNRLDLSQGYPLLLNPNGGNVGIGATSPSYKLEVAGSVRATSFVANSNTYADFVFKPDYKLRALSEVEAAIKANGHLPDIPSEAEAKARGIDLAQMQVKLLQKVEELTLYLVEHEKDLQVQRQTLQQVQMENAALRSRLSELEKR